MTTATATYTGNRPTVHDLFCGAGQIDANKVAAVYDHGKYTAILVEGQILNLANSYAWVVALVASHRSTEQDPR